ncbi:MAG: sialidase family protein, partial [Acidobacteria bacterium]|nr:sialidase family protein [Acidobacteriota bacterium]
QNLEGRMPMSVSADWGKTWEYKSSIWPPIAGSQRLVLLRLKEGPLLLITFVKDPRRLDWAQTGKADDRGMTSMVAAVSYDDGQTWPDRRVISDGRPEHGARTLAGGWIRMSPATSEPIGYLAASQARNGMIHLISSNSHYAFNLAWIRQGQPEGERGPAPKALARRAALGETIEPGKRTIERTGVWDSLQPERGFTVDARGTSFELEAFIRTGMQTTNHYRLRVGPVGVEYWHENRFLKLAGGDGALHRYRLAVRDDTAVQVYRDAELIGVQDAEVMIDWRQAARGKYMDWTGSVEGLGFDLRGSYAP